MIKTKKQVKRKLKSLGLQCEELYNDSVNNIEDEFFVQRVHGMVYNKLEIMRSISWLTGINYKQFIPIETRKILV